MTTDPNQLLKELRDYVDGWKYVTDTSVWIQKRKFQPNRPLYAPYTLHAQGAYYNRIMELFQTLDGWLTRGEALPDAWDHNGPNPLPDPGAAEAHEGFLTAMEIIDSQTGE